MVRLTLEHLLMVHHNTYNLIHQQQPMLLLVFPVEYSQ